MGEFRAVLELAALPRGTMRAVRHGERELLICHTHAGVFALDNLCTHAEARLCEGRLRKLSVVCPLHGGAFDVRDGMPLKAPALTALRHYPVRISGTAIEVAL